MDEERPLDLVPADVGDLGEGAGEREDRLAVERRPGRPGRRGNRRERCHREHSYLSMSTLPPTGAKTGLGNLGLVNWVIHGLVSISERGQRGLTVGRCNSDPLRPLTCRMKETAFYDAPALISNK